MTPLQSRHAKRLLLVGVVLVAVFLRLYSIGSLPPSDAWDPACYGLDALAILEGARPVFFPTNFGREVLTYRFIRSRGHHYLCLYYQRLNKMGTDYTVFTQLLGPYNPANGGPLWGQDDSEPCLRFYPTSAWDSGEIVRDQYTISVPEETPSGDYQLIMGFYNWRTFERLPVLDAAGQAVADHVVLGQAPIMRAD